MRPIQIILVLLSVAFVFFYSSRIKTRSLGRLVLLGTAAVAIVLVLRPDWSSDLANLLGVGRGADLVNYLGLMGLGFVCLQLYSKVRELEGMLTGLIRTDAIAHARIPTDTSSDE